jgi:hypothetical protein
MVGSAAPSSRDFNVLVIYADSLGNPHWKKTFGADGNDLWDNAFGVVENEGFVITGFTCLQGGESTKAWIFKLDYNGEIVWSKIYNTGIGDDASYAITKTQNGGYAIATTKRIDKYARVNGNACIINTDSIGDSIWSAHFDIDTYEYPTAIYQKNDGGFIVAGHTANIGPRYSYVIRTNWRGDSVWALIFNDPINNRINSFVEVKENEYVCTGVKRSPTTNKDGLWIVKIVDDTTTPNIDGSYQFSNSCSSLSLYKVESRLYINYTIPFSSKIKIELYDIRGRLIKTISELFVEKGAYSAIWNIEKSLLSGGVYILKISINGDTFIRHITLVN